MNKKLLTILAATVATVLLFVAAYYLYSHLELTVKEDLVVGNTLQSTVGGEKTKNTEPSRESATKSDQKQGATPSPNGTDSSATTVDYKAPEIVLSNNLQEKVALSELKGKVVVLNFWASWCYPCKAEFPDFERFYLENKDNAAVYLYSVNLTNGSRESKEQADAFMAKNNYTLPYFYDTESQAATDYRVASIPTTYIIDPKGDLFYYHVGAISYEELKKQVTEAGK